MFRFLQTVILVAPWQMLQGLLPVLYFGPETILPISSVLASIIGLVLLFWRHLARIGRRLLRRQPEPTEQIQAETNRSEEQEPESVNADRTL